MTRQPAIAIHAPAKRNKYGAVKVSLDGYTFDSKREAAYYAELKIRQRAGEIGDIAVHPRYMIVSNGFEITTYTADFAFNDLKTGRRHVVDVKSPITAAKRDFKLVAKLFRAQFGFDLQVVF